MQLDKLKKYFAMSCVCFLTGIFLSMSIKAYMNVTQMPTDSKNQTLIEVITTLEQETNEIQAEIDALNAAMAQAAENGGLDKDHLNALQMQMENLKFIAGQTEVAGPGITITLDDNATGAATAKVADPQNFLAANYIVHDSNLRYLVNDLASLTEAVSINGQRIVTTTDIRCVGTVIMVNSTRLAPPFEIKMIGSPALLEAAALDSSQYNLLKTSNMPIKITRENNLAIPAYSGPINAIYAQVVETTKDTTTKIGQRQ